MEVYTLEGKSVYIEYKDSAKCAQLPSTGTVINDSPYIIGIKSAYSGQVTFVSKENIYKMEVSE
jgi:hypothetical protein